jgi:hypothetical protein
MPGLIHTIDKMTNSETQKTLLRHVETIRNTYFEVS